VTETQLVSREYFWDKIHPVVVKEDNIYKETDENMKYTFN